MKYLSSCNRRRLTRRSVIIVSQRKNGTILSVNLIDINELRRRLRTGGNEIIYGFRVKHLKRHTKT